jgi:hypothetical protein
MSYAANRVAIVAAGCQILPLVRLHGRQLALMCGWMRQQQCG